MGKCHQRNTKGKASGTCGREVDQGLFEELEDIKSGWTGGTTGEAQRAMAEDGGFCSD